MPRTITKPQSALERRSEAQGRPGLPISKAPAAKEGTDRKLLDPTAWRLLGELEHDARASLAELGRRVGLTAPAVAERLRRLEEAGVIRGYRAVLEPAQLGFGAQAFIRLTIERSRTPEQVARELDAFPEVLECHRVTGDDCFIMRVGVGGVTELEPLIDRLRRLGTTVTSLILSSPVEQRLITRSRKALSGSR